MEGLERNAGGVQRVRVPVQEVAAKFSTKTEAYHFVTQEMKAYCPHKDVVTAFHLKDMISGAKGFIRDSEIQHMTVPQYETLSLERILEWARARHPAVVSRYFPIERELLKFPRQVSCLMMAFKAVVVLASVHSCVKAASTHPCVCREA